LPETKSLLLGVQEKMSARDEELAKSGRAIEAMGKTIEAQRRLTARTPILGTLSLMAMVVGFSLLLGGHALGFIHLGG
jgi:hypothetical protein